jgi:hypothetical protein
MMAQVALGVLREHLYILRWRKMGIRRLNKSLVQRTGGDSIFGNGQDGSVTITSPTVTHMTRDMYYSSLTVNSGATLFTNGFRVFVKDTLTNNGTIGFPAATSANVSDGSGTVAGRQSSLNPANAWGVSTSSISSTALNDLDDAMAGWFITANGTQTKIGSGSLGATGNAGTISANAGAGGAGSAGPLGIFPGATAGQAGGIGNSGSSGNAATAGTGGAGKVAGVGLTDDRDESDPAGAGVVAAVERICAGEDWHHHHHARDHTHVFTPAHKHAY